MNYTKWKMRFRQLKHHCLRPRRLLLIAVLFTLVILVALAYRKWNSRVLLYSCTDNIYGKKNIIDKLSNTEGIYMKETTDERPLIQFITHPKAVEAALVDGVCQRNPGETKWNIVFLVKSAQKNSDRRDSIRSTWGSIKIFDDVIFQVVFILGKSADNAENMRLKIEASKYGDILLCDVEDSSKFVPEKVLAGMQWSSNFLPENWIYASIDDDIVINPSSFVDYFDQLIGKFTNTKGKVCFDDLPMACVYNYQSADPPSRNENSKWYMPPEKFPGYYWPVYCRGGMYTTSSKMVKDLFEKSRRTAHLYLDDVWITGFMRRKLNMGDYNIVAPPMSVMAEEETYKDHNIEDLLVKHLWGNVENIEVHVPSKLRDVWNAFEPKIKDKMQCTT
ncbi:beta-1,3-galactosyltransferase 1-like [Clavelina lepadiformis]|uniref:beta-1,3-galactosyltransferase 1-like n=1 Tax=Clavelina lepadiformis TaxID=159417 RepID=UPI00404133CE